MAKVVSINKGKENVHSSLKSLLKSFEEGDVISFVGIAMHKDDGLWILHDRRGIRAQVASGWIGTSIISVPC